VPRARPVLGITLEGPFFERDPRKTFRQNVRRYMDRIAEVGEAEIKRRETGNASAASTRDHVWGRTSSLAGKRWAVTARVSVSTQGLDKPQAVRRMAIAAGRHVAVTKAGRNIGTTKGAEGRNHAFRDGKKAILDAARANAHLLVEDLN
jgi:hypothetical protein